MSDLLHAMYGPEDGDDPTKPKRELPTAPPAANQRTRRVIVGGVSYEVPTVEYVKRLEDAVTKQDQAIRRLVREVIALRQALRKTATTADLDEIRRDYGA